MQTATLDMSIGHRVNHRCVAATMSAPTAPATTHVGRKSRTAAARIATPRAPLSTYARRGTGGTGGAPAGLTAGTLTPLACATGLADARRELRLPGRVE